MGERGGNLNTRDTQPSQDPSTLIALRFELLRNKSSRVALWKLTGSLVRLCYVHFVNFLGWSFHTSLINCQSPPTYLFLGRGFIGLDKEKKVAQGTVCFNQVL
jgi:hypothetical protein